MPRVSEAHLAARRQQIVNAARVCFARNGFHATSMQDVITEAGLSVGAFYRYFKSKEELIGAIAEQVVGMVSGAMAELLTQQPPLPLDEAMSQLIEMFEPQLQASGSFPLAIQVWSESLRNPDLAVWVRQVYAKLRGYFRELVVQHQRVGTLPADVDADAVASVLFSTALGFALQRVLLGNPSREQYQAGLRVVLSQG